MLHEAIKEARKAKNLSQKDLATALHVVRQTVSKWETGLSVPDADVLVQLAALLDVSVGDLLGLEIQEPAAEDLRRALAEANAELAAIKQEQALQVQTAKVRGWIALPCFAVLLITLHVHHVWISALLIGGCMLAALCILYRNLALLTRPAATSRLGPLKATTLFDMVLVVLVVACIVLDQISVLSLSETAEVRFAVLLVSLVILASGLLLPDLPRNRHTGLRLPWTVQDEDAWRIAHKTLRYLSLPLVLLYLAAA